MVSIRRKKNVMKNFRMYAKLAQKKPTSHIFITFLFSAVLLWHICNGTVPTQNRKWTVFFSFRWTLCMPNIDDAWYVNNKMIILIISSWQQRILIFFFLANSVFIADLQKPWRILEPCPHTEIERISTVSIPFNNIPIIHRTIFSTSHSDERQPRTWLIYCWFINYH